MSRQFQTPAKTFIHTSLIALAGLTVSAPLYAAASKLESDSPFLPAGYNTKKPEPPKPAPKANGPLSREIEFRGVVQMNGIYEFSLFHKKDNRSYWITENGSENGISVRDFDLNTMKVTVTLNGRAEQLTLMTATDSPLPVVASSVKQPTKQPKQPNIPGLNTNANKKPRSSRVIPRRRVILPKKK